MSIKPLGAIVRLTGPVTNFTGTLESVAVTLKFDTPAVVGVPVITQPEPRFNPAGSEPLARMQL